jgi:hypothetical protein
MALARELLSDGCLFDLLDFIAVAGGVFVTLGFDRFVEAALELGKAFGDRLAVEGFVWNLAGVLGSFVHVIEHRLDHALKRLVAMRATKAAMFLEVALSESAMFAT